MPENTKPAGANGGFREILASDWKACEKNTLHGFLTLNLPGGLVLCIVFATPEHRESFQAAAFDAVDRHFEGVQGE